MLSHANCDGLQSSVLTSFPPEERPAHAHNMPPERWITSWLRLIGYNIEGKPGANAS